MKYCKKCDKEISEDFRHCPECGKKLSQIVRDVVKKELEKKHSEKVIEFDLFAKKTIFSIIIVAAAIIALGFVIANPTSLNLNETTTTSTVAPTTTIVAPTTSTIPNFDITVNVINEYTNGPIEGAAVYLNDESRGVTDQSGKIIIKNVLKGSYYLRACHPVYRDICAKILKEVPSSDYIVVIKAPVDVMLTVKDTQTQKVVDYVKVGLEDRSGKTITTDTTTQQGTVLAKDIIPSEYRIGIYLIEQGQEIVVRSEYKNIGSENQATIDVNMPNPDLSIIDTKKDKVYFCPAPCSRLDVKVTVMNSGDYGAENVFAIVSLYNVDEKGDPIGTPYSQDSIKFDYIGKGKSETGYVKQIDRTIWKDQKLVVVLFDTSKYSLPKDKTNIVSSDRNRGMEIIDETLEYCQHNFSNCVSEFVKVVDAVAPLVVAS